MDRFLITVTVVFVLVSYGNVCVADNFGDLGDVTMQVIGPEEIPADIIQNIQLPELNQIGIKSIIAPATSENIPSADNQTFPGSRMIIVEPIPFDPGQPFDPTHPVDPGTIDPGFQMPPMPPIPTEGPPIDFPPPPDPNFMVPNRNME